MPEKSTDPDYTVGERIARSRLGNPKSTTYETIVPITSDWRIARHPGLIFTLLWYHEFRR